MMQKQRQSRPYRALLAQVALAVVLAMGACSSGQKPISTPPDPSGGAGSGQGTVDNTAPKPALVVRGTGEGDDRDAAYAVAAAQLTSALLTEEGARYAAHAGIAAHDAKADYLAEKDIQGGRVQVTIGLTATRANAVLAAMDEHHWDVRGPGFMSEILAPVMAARVAAVTCQQRTRFRSVAPPPPGPDVAEPAPPQEPGCPDLPDASADASAEVAELIASVRLRPYYNGGVPLAADGRPLRSVLLVAERQTGGQWLPFAGLPVVVEGGADAGLFATSKIESDDSGLAILSFVQGVTWPDEGVAVAIDRQHLLGPFADLWPAERATVALQGRKIGMKRWTLISDERVDGKSASADAFAEALDRTVRNGGGGSMVRIKSSVAKKLLSAAPGDLTSQLPDLADVWDGDIDILVVSRAQSNFAGRMSTTSVWFEAKAEIVVYSAWTGQEVARFQDRSTASGIGNERADREARTRVAEKLAAKLLATY